MFGSFEAIGDLMDLLHMYNIHGTLSFSLQSGPFGGNVTHVSLSKDNEHLKQSLRRSKFWHSYVTLTYANPR